MSSEAGLLEGLDLFHGAASGHSARIYARLSLSPGVLETLGGVPRLEGYVRGPYCELAKTLPFTTPFADAGPGDSLLAAALMPDPCFWSPDVPARYNVRVNLLRGRETLETADFELAMRNFGVRGKNLYLDGRRWVLRGICQDECPLEELPMWREERAALVVSEPTAEFCRQATRQGVLLVACLEAAEPRQAVLARLRRLSRFGAVAMALVRSGEFSVNELRQAAPNMLFAREMGPAATALAEQGPAGRLSLDADLALVEARPCERLAEIAGRYAAPVVAYRPLPAPLPLRAARAACDDLQRDLAPFGDFAGYVV